MFDQILTILDYVVESFIHIWPYLLVTIPIAVAVNMSGASKHISKAFSARPIVAIILATIVGAFSPFCSCGVIPVIAAMLIGGVPLAPVMSFWLASPSMDPEIFFLSASMLGWNLAVWRLAATLALSLGGGFATHFLVQSGWIGQNILRHTQSTQVKTYWQVFKDGLQAISSKLRPQTLATETALSTEASGCTDSGCSPSASPALLQTATFSSTATFPLPLSQGESQEESTCGCDEGSSCATEVKVESSFWARLASETWIATSMVIKFMLLAWFIGALVNLYVPETWITSVLGGDNPWAIFTAAVLGVPVYTSNLTAMPLVGGLLAQGMNPAAALSFLIAGPMTTLPAMSAVWGLVNRKVFSLYIGFALFGAVVLAYVYNIALSF
ncbi:MAG: permease [Anaerolineae bacterium]|nr:permease [Anaerolineae bacterium]